LLLVPGDAGIPAPPRGFRQLAHRLDLQEPAPWLLCPANVGLAVRFLPTIVAAKDLLRF